MRAAAKHDMAMADKQSNAAAAQSVLLQGTLQELHKRLASQGDAQVKLSSRSQAGKRTSTSRHGTSVPNLRMRERDLHAERHAAEQHRVAKESLMREEA